MARIIDREALVEAMAGLEPTDPFFSSIFASELARKLGLETVSHPHRDEILNILLRNFVNKLYKITFNLNCSDEILPKSFSSRDRIISLLDWAEDNQRMNDLIDCLIGIVQKGNFGKPEELVEELTQLKVID
jgi:hypothetical protein